MKKIALLSLLAMSAFGASWTGVISDAKCGKGHADASEKSMNCVKGCVKGGQAAVFVVGDNVYKLDAKGQELAKEHLGHKVTVEGSLNGDTVAATAMKMAH